MALGVSEETLRFVLEIRDNLSGKVGGIIRSVDGLSRSVAGGLRGAFATAGGAILSVLRSISLAIVSAAKQVATLGAALLAVSAGALGAALYKAVNAAADFGSAMAEVFTIFRGGEADRAALIASVEKISATFARSPIDSAKALYDVISAGYSDAASAAQVFEQATKLAVGGATDQKTAFTGLNSAMQAYRLGAGKAAQVSDLIFKTVEKGLTTVGQLGTALPRVAAGAAQAGLSLQETLAAIATITSKGLSTDEAVTQLRGLIQSISIGAEKAKELRDQFGVQVDFSPSTLSAQGFFQMLGNVSGQLKKLDADARGKALQILVGSIEGQSAFRLLTQDIGGAIAMLAEFDTAAGMTQRALELMTDQPKFKIEALKVAVNLAFVEMGKAIEPAVKPGLDYLTEAVLRVRDLIKSHAEDIQASFESLLPVLQSVANATFSASAVMVAALLAVGQNIKNSDQLIALFALSASANFKLVSLEVQSMGMSWASFKTATAAGTASFLSGVETMMRGAEQFGVLFKSVFAQVGLAAAQLLRDLVLKFQEFFKWFGGLLTAALPASSMFAGFADWLTDGLDKGAAKLADTLDGIAAYWDGFLNDLDMSAGREHTLMAKALEDEAANQLTILASLKLDKADMEGSIALAKAVAEKARAVFTKEFSQWSGDVKFDFRDSLTALQQFRDQFTSFVGSVDNMDAATGLQASEAMEQIRLLTDQVELAEAGAHKATMGFEGFFAGVREGFAEVNKSMADTFTKGQGAVSALASSLGEGLTVAVGDMLAGIKTAQQVMQEQVIGVPDFDFEAAIPALKEFEKQVATVAKSMQGVNSAAAQQADQALAQIRALIAEMENLDASLKPAQTGWSGFFAGLKAGFTETATTMQNTFEAGKQAADHLVGVMSDGLVTAFQEVSDGTKTAGQAFRDYAVTVLREIQSIILKMTILIAMSKLLGSLGLGGGAVGQAFGAATGFQVAGQASANAAGSGIFGAILSGIGSLFSGFKLFDAGGIAAGPQIARLAQNGIPEAVVPMPGGRNIPVELRTSGRKRGGEAEAQAAAPTPQPVVIAFTIHATDKRGIKELLVEHKGTIEQTIISAMSSSGKMKQAVQQAAGLTTR